jgi:hypothetical protein
LPLKALALAATEHGTRHRSRLTRSQAHLDQAAMHFHLAAQRPQMPACRHDCVHVAQVSHVLGAWEKRGMRSRCYGRGCHQHNYMCCIRDSDLADYPRTWTWDFADDPVNNGADDGSAWLERQGTHKPSPKPHDAHSRYLHTDTQAQRPIKACQGRPARLSCNSAASALCR